MPLGEMMVWIISLVAAAAISATPQSTLNDRAGNDLAKADAAMNVQYRSTIAAMKKMDDFDAPDARTGPTYRDAVLKSQRAWLAFRDAECLAEGYEFRGGSAQLMTVVSCKASLTRARTVQLKALAK